MGPIGLRDCPIGPFQSSYDVDGFWFAYVDTRLDSPLYLDNYACILFQKLNSIPHDGVVCF